MKMMQLALGAGLALALLGAQNSFAITTQDLQKLENTIMEHKNDIITRLKTDPQFRTTALMYLGFIHAKLNNLHTAIAQLPQEYKDKLAELKDQFEQKKGDLYKKLQTMTKEQFEQALQQATGKIKKFLDDLRARRDLMPLIPPMVGTGG